MGSLGSCFSRTWAVNGFLFFFGLATILIGEYSVDLLPFVIVEFWKSVTIHIGTAFMVAAIVGLVIEFTEYTDFFEKRLSSVLTGNTFAAFFGKNLSAVLMGNEFIKMLNPNKLNEINVLAMKKMIENKANNPDYNAMSLPDAINKSVISDMGQKYRDNWFNTIRYEILDSKGVKNLLNSEPTPELKEKVVQITIETQYDLISPHLYYSTEEQIAYLWTVRKVPGLDTMHHWQFYLSIDGNDIPIDVNSFIKENGLGQTTLDLKKIFTLTRKAAIKYKVIIYQFGDCGYYSSYFEGLTHNARINFSSNKDLNLMAEIFGLKEYDPWPNPVGPNHIAIELKGWALEGHGYYIAWS
jgi:hypothetical protein